MTDLSFGIILDFIVLAALALMIFYALRLSRQFSALQKDKSELEKLTVNLSNAANRADVAVKNMKEAALGSGEALQSKINVARSLFDELEIMVQAGDNLAERLSKIAEDSRKAAKGQDDEKKKRPEKKSEPRAIKAKPAKTLAVKKTNKTKSKDILADDIDEPRSRAERELLEAIKAKQK